MIRLRPSHRMYILLFAFFASLVNVKCGLSLTQCAGDCFMGFMGGYPTVDGRNPAPAGSFLLVIGFQGFVLDLRKRKIPITPNLTMAHTLAGSGIPGSV